MGMPGKPIKVRLEKSRKIGRMLSSRFITWAAIYSELIDREQHRDANNNFSALEIDNFSRIFRKIYTINKQNNIIKKSILMKNIKKNKFPFFYII